MSRRRGWTLIELLAVFTIAALLSSLLYPVFAEARREAKQTHCIDNLRQIGLAVSLYRTEYNGDGVYGTIEEMGLPEKTLSLIQSTRTSPTLFHCTEKNAEGKQKLYLTFFTPEGTVGVPSWSSYAKAHREQSILFGDPNHDFPGVNSSPFAVHRALALHLDTHVTKIVRAGDRYDRSWWHPEGNSEAP